MNFGKRFSSEKPTQLRMVRAFQCVHAFCFRTS